MYQERIREEAKLICQRHAAIGGVGPNDAKMAFLLKVQGSLSPSLIFNQSTVVELVRELDMTSDVFIYVLDVYSDLASLIFPSEEQFKEVVEEYVNSFGRCGQVATELPGPLQSLGKSLPNYDEVRNALNKFPFLIAIHAMTTWLFPVTPEKKGVKK